MPRPVEPGHTRNAYGRRTFLTFAGAAGAALAGAPAAGAATWETVLSGSFANRAALEAGWHYPPVY